MEGNSNNKRLVKNTMMLYFRQFFTLGLSLYTSRLTLKALGVTDFGIYATVAGVTALLSIITSSLSASTQRFMTFEMGRKDIERLNQVYRSSVQLHVVLSILFVIVAESIGMWFIYHKLIIPEPRLMIAVYIFQLSILDCVLTLLNVPNQASIIAHEDMGSFAFFSISDAILKLIAVVLLFYVPWDKLLFYAFSLFIIQIISRLVSIVYCRIKYKYIKYRHVFDIRLIKEMFSLAGWNIYSNMCTMGFIQGVNILLNIFFGPVLNAAYTIAMQAYSGIRSFCSSFQLASNPQIVKAYSERDYERLNKLLITVCKMSFFLIFFLSLPFLINAEFVLKIWLSKVPEHTQNFFCLLLVFAFIDVLAYPMDVVAQATGKVRKYYLRTSFFILLSLPVSYVLYKVGAHPEVIYYVAIILSLTGIFVRLLVISKILSFDFITLISEILLKILLVGISGCILPLLFKYILGGDVLWKVAINSLLCLLSIFISVYFLGLNKAEKNGLKKILISKI